MREAIDRLNQCLDLLESEQDRLTAAGWLWDLLDTHDTVKPNPGDDIRPGV